MCYFVYATYFIVLMFNSYEQTMCNYRETNLKFKSKQNVIAYAIASNMHRIDRFSGRYIQIVLPIQEETLNFNDAKNW